MNDNGKRSDRSSGKVNRRRLLEVLAGTGAIGLAGCLSGDGEDSDPTDSNDSTDGNGDDSNGGGDGNGDGNGSNTPPDGEPVTDEFIWLAGSFVPNEINANKWGPASDLPWWIDRVWGQQLLHTNLQGEQQKMMVESYQIVDDGAALEVSLNDDYTFWDGSTVGPQDALLDHTLWNYQNFGQATDPENPVEIVGSDPTTLRWTQSCPTGENLLLRNLTFETVFGKYSQWEDIIERYEDASSDSELNEVTQDLADRTYSLEDVREIPMGVGLWIPTEATADYLVHEKYEDHPLADQTNLTKFRMQMSTDNQRAQQEAAAGNIDVASQSTVGDVDNPDFERVHEVPTGAQINLRFNWRNEHLAKRNVRRAMAYAIDYEEIVEALDSGQDVPAGTVQHQDRASPVIRNFMSDGFTDQYIDYGTTADTETASELLRSEGYELNDGIWEDEDGSQLLFEHVTPDWSPYGFVSQYIAGKLKDFGIELEVQIPSGAGHGQIWDESYDFDTATYFQQGGHPAQWYRVDSSQGDGWEYLAGLIDTDEADDLESCPDIDEIERPPLTGDRDARTHMPVDLEYPTEVGATDLSGETETLTPFVNAALLERTQDSEELATLTEEFAWTANFNVTAIGLYNEVFAYQGNTARIEFPPEGSYWYNTRQPWLWLGSASVQAKTE